MLVEPTDARDQDARDMERCREGDAEALGDLYDRHAREVQRLLLALRVGLDRASLDDALQETFLRLLADAKRGRYDSSRPLRPYLLGMARNVAVTFARRRREAPMANESERGDGRAEPPELAIGRETSSRVAAALVALDPEMRSLLVLKHEHGLTMIELAAALRCSVPTARARLGEAAVRFARELRRCGLDPKESVS